MAEGFKRTFVSGDVLHFPWSMPGGIQLECSENMLFEMEFGFASMVFISSNSFLKALISEASCA